MFGSFAAPKSLYNPTCCAMFVCCGSHLGIRCSCCLCESSNSHLKAKLHLLGIFWSVSILKKMTFQPCFFLALQSFFFIIIIFFCNFCTENVAPSLFVILQQQEQQTYLQLLGHHSYKNIPPVNFFNLHGPHKCRNILNSITEHFLSSSLSTYTVTCQSLDSG